MSETTYNFSGRLYLNKYIGRYEIIFKVILQNSCIFWGGPYCSVPEIQEYPGKSEVFYWPVQLPSRYYRVERPIKKLTKRRVWNFIKKVNKDSCIHRDNNSIEIYILNNKSVFIQDLGELDPAYLFHKLEPDYIGSDVFHNSLRRAVIKELKNRKT